jgi:hypothetical protein
VTTPLLAIPVAHGEQILLGWRGGCRMRQDTWRTFSSSPRTGNAAYSGCASRHREFEGFMMIIA